MWLDSGATMQQTFPILLILRVLGSVALKPWHLPGLFRFQPNAEF